MRWAICCICCTTWQVRSVVWSASLATFNKYLHRETDWLFGTKNGRDDLTEEANYQRLLIVHLNRSHLYESISAIIKELSVKIMELAPKNLPKSYKVYSRANHFAFCFKLYPNWLYMFSKTPILSEGPDVDIRHLKYKGSSKFSGEFYVEDVKCQTDNFTTRRLIFQNMNTVIQTEIIMKSGSNSVCKSHVFRLGRHSGFSNCHFKEAIIHS
jgi:hypothetical protein